MLCRSHARAERVGLDGASIVEMDLSDLSSVRRAASALGTFDVLIANAGVGGARGLTVDGFELAFGTNYLGHALLVRRLLPKLAKDARIVHLGSGSHAHGALDWDAVRAPTRSFTGIAEYAASKLAVMLFHHELSRRLAGTSITSVVADPGNVASEAYRHLPWPLRPLWTLGMKSPELGAATPLFCACEPVVHGASYVDARPFVPAPRARDRALARTLWEHTDRWLGEAT